MSCTATRRKNGKPCGCAGFSRREKDEKCICKHKESEHVPHVGVIKDQQPQSMLNSVLSKYSTARTSISQRPQVAATSDARRETNSGFRVKAVATSSVIPGSSIGNQKPKIDAKKRKRSTHDAPSNLKPDKFVKVGSILLIPCGLDVCISLSLQDDKAPNGKRIETLRKYGLAVFKDGNGDLEYSESWSQERIDVWLRRLLPLPFQWLDSKFGKPAQGDYHWMLAKKEYSKIFLLERSVVTADDLHHARGSIKRNFKDSCIRFVTRHSIKSATYRDWEHALEQLEAPSDDAGADEWDTEVAVGSDEGSNSDMQTPVNQRRTRSSRLSPTVINISDSDSSPRSSSRVHHRKGKERALSPASKLDDDDDDNEAVSLSNSDMIAAAPQRKSCPLAPIAAKRPASPIDDLEEAEGRGKQAKKVKEWFSAVNWEDFDDTATESSFASANETAEPLHDGLSLASATLAPGPDPPASTAPPTATGHAHAGNSTLTSSVPSLDIQGPPAQLRNALSTTNVTNSPTLPPRAPPQPPHKQVLPSRRLAFSRANKTQYNPWN